MQPTSLTKLVKETSKDDVYMTVRQLLSQYSGNGTSADPGDLKTALTEASQRGYFSTCILLLKEGAEVSEQAIGAANDNEYSKLGLLLTLSRNLVNRHSRNFALFCSVFVKPSRQNDNYVFNLLKAGADPFFQGGIVYRLALKFQYGTYVGVLRQTCRLSQLAEHALLGAIYDNDVESVTNLLTRRTHFGVAHYKAVIRTQNRDVVKAVIDSGCYNFTEADFSGFQNSNNTSAGTTMPSTTQVAPSIEVEN